MEKLDFDINYSIPVFISDFKEMANSSYSFAKLKVFYIGETADKRLFTKEFSDKVIKTLPYAPIVGYYNEETEDFEGHNKEVQHIYGIVPESSDIEYVEEDDKSYAVSDVILYTGRKDKTGEIAKKIVGKPHSLELNPDDTKVKVNKDSNGEFINLEFTEGSLLGLSVLGSDEKPAFEGSEFFNNKNFFKDTLKELLEEYHSFVELKEQRGEVMGKEKNITAFYEFKKDFEPILNFIKMEQGEKNLALYKALKNNHGDRFFVAQIFDDNVVIAKYNDDFEVEHYRIGYSINESSEISFTEEERVYQRFLTTDEISSWEEFLVSLDAKKKDDDEDEEDEKDYVEDDDDDEEDEDDEDENYTDNQGESSEFVENSDDNLDENPDPKKENFIDADSENAQHDGDDLNAEQEEEEGSENEQIGTAALDHSEREELETLRREKKEQIISSFEDDLDEEFLAAIRNDIDNYTYDELDAKLSKEFTRITRENKTKQKINPFVYNKSNTTNSNDPLERVKKLVKLYK